MVVLLTPDDDARLKESFWEANEPDYETQFTGQARPNVFFEAGMAMAGNQDRTILMEIGPVRPFSDVAGRHAVRFYDSTESRQELAQRLETAGCPVNLKGIRWQTAGDFKSVIAGVDD